MIHLYAFVHGLRSLPAGERLETHGFGSVEAVIGPVPTRGALAHGLVVESLLDGADAVLPVRFGPPFATRDALVQSTIPHLPSLRSQLMHVRGCVEVSVRIAGESGQPPQSRDGASYLRALAASASRIDANATEAHEALRALALDSRVERPAAGDVRFEGAYLVRRGDVDAFARRVDELAARTPDLPILCTGPWAPSSFARGAA